MDGQVKRSRATRHRKVINVTLSDRARELLDAEAQARSVTRSGLLEELVLTVLGR